MEQNPAVFLSSTLFDLRQVRADIRRFVEDELGYRLVASEYPSFPVDPALDTIENCRQRVERDADIFVLVVGSRYGSIPDGHNHSVTNLEYSTARLNRIPIFAFIHRDLLAQLPLWQSNPNGNFLAVVDTPRVFEFISQIRAEDRVWSFPFDTAQDIVATLRIQLAYLARRGFNVVRQMANGADYVRELRGNAMQIVSDRPKGWPTLLTAELVEQELLLFRRLRDDYRSGFTPARGEQLSEFEFGQWMASRTNEARRITDQLTITLNETLNTACEQKDVYAIIYGASRIGVAYRDALEWSLRVRSVHAPEALRNPVSILATFLDSIINQLDGLARQLRDAIADLSASDVTHGQVKVVLEINESTTRSFREALDEAAKRILVERKNK